MIDPGDTLAMMMFGSAPASGAAALVRQTITWNTVLTTNSTTTGGGPYTTASVAPVGDIPVYAGVVVCIASGTAAEFTLSGNGLTWVSVATVAFGVRRLTLFRAQGAAPSAGAVTITSSDTLTSAVWSIFQPNANKVDNSGTNGSGSIVQSTTGSAVGGSTTVNATLGAFEHATNHHLAIIALSTQATVTNDADFTELTTDNEASSAVTLAVHYAANQVACDPTFTSAAAGIVSAEIKSIAI